MIFRVRRPCMYVAPDSVTKHPLTWDQILVASLYVGFVVFGLVLCLSASAAEVCTSDPCTANGVTEFSATAAQNGSKGAVETDVDLTPNGTGNPTGRREIWHITGSGVGTPQGTVGYMHGTNGSSATILNYFQNDSTNTNQVWMGGNSIIRGGSFGTTSGYNFGALIQASGSSTLNTAIVGFANGSTGYNVGGAFLATHGGQQATALYAGSHAAIPSFVPSVLQVNSSSIVPVPVVVWQVDGITVATIKRNTVSQLVDPYPYFTKPTCDASNRGGSWYSKGASGVADTYEVCLKDASDSYNWREVATP